MGKFRLKFKKFSEKLLNLLYPKGLTCNFCGKELDDEERDNSLCKDCRGKLHAPQFDTVICEAVEISGCFLYDDVARYYVLSYKDSAKPFIAEYMAKFMYEKFLEKGIEADKVCFVPSSEKKTSLRGYDAMRCVAEEFCRLSRLPLSDVLFRKEGLDQTEVLPEERKDNVKDKFLSRGPVEGTILLLDDVATTGATIGECAETLCKHGAEKVVALTFAFARGFGGNS